jgi:hypothetical protein
VLIRYPLTEIPIPGISATGGNIYEYQQGEAIFTVHEFSQVGSSTFNIESIEKEDIAEVDVLVVGGGGAGGVHHGGGGGAGGLVFLDNIVVSPQNYTIVIGAGGIGKAGNNNTQSIEGNPGQNSTAFGLTAIGGGAGAGWSIPNRRNSQNGGSGGGAQNWVSSGVGGLGQQPGSASGGFGNTARNTGTTADFGGGGAGAGSAGGGGFRDLDGGAGRDYGDIFGRNVGHNGWFAGGGGAGNYTNPGTNTTQTGFGNGGASNFGGGGRGPVTINGTHSSVNEGSPRSTAGTITAAINGMPGTGGGGGGNPSYFPGVFSGDGGSGVVLIRYVSGVSQQ